MKKFSVGAGLLAAGALCAAAFAGSASATVTVTFVQPERFADMPFAPWDKERVMKDLEEYMVKMGAKFVPAGEDLKLEVLDIDLAGTLRDGPGGKQIRVLNGGADWPKMEVRYSLESGGKVLKSGTDRLADMNYFNSHVTDRSKLRDSQFYEKQMLQDWFRDKFAAAPK